VGLTNAERQARWRARREQEIAALKARAKEAQNMTKREHAYAQAYGEYGGRLMLVSIDNCFRAGRTRDPLKIAEAHAWHNILKAAIPKMPKPPKQKRGSRIKHALSESDTSSAG
jgi:hypothetical protein